MIRNRNRTTIENGSRGREGMGSEVVEVEYCSPLSYPACKPKPTPTLPAAC